MDDIQRTDEVSGYDAAKIAEIRAREIAREAVASLCGLVLRRLQDDRLTRSIHGVAIDERLSTIFGEALQQFSAEESKES